MWLGIIAFSKRTYRKRNYRFKVHFFSTIHCYHDFKSFGIEYLFYILHEVSNLRLFIILFINNCIIILYYLYYLFIKTTIL